MSQKITVKGTTSFYLATLKKPSDPMYPLVSMLSAFDPKFVGANFIYQPADKTLFFSQVNLATAIGVNSHPGVVEFSGYPFFVATDDKGAPVPVGWPNSIKYADDDEAQKTPSQRTFEEWGNAIGNECNAYDDGGTKKYVIGDLNRYGLSFAAASQAAGYELIDEAAYRTLGTSKSTPLSIVSTVDDFEPVDSESVAL